MDESVTLFGGDPDAVQIIGIAVLHLLTDRNDVSRESVADMIQVLYFERLDDVPVQQAVHVLLLPGAGGLSVTGVPGQV